MEIDPQLFYALFSLGQFVLCGIAAWTLTAVIKQGNRLTIAKPTHQRTA